MTFPLGFTGLGAEIVDVEKRGKERILTLTAQGWNKRAAIRAARNEAASIIPFRDQDVTRIIEERKLGMVNKRFLVTVAHNVDEY